MELEDVELRRKEATDHTCRSRQQRSSSDLNLNPFNTPSPPLRPFSSFHIVWIKWFFSSVPSSVFVSALSSRAFVVFLPGWLGWYRLAELSAVLTVRCCCPLCPTLPPGGVEELSQRHLRCLRRDSLQTARSLKQYINETTDAGKADMD